MKNLSMFQDFPATFNRWYLSPDDQAMESQNGLNGELAEVQLV